MKPVTKFFDILIGLSAEGGEEVKIKIEEVNQVELTITGDLPQFDLERIIEAFDTKTYGLRAIEKDKITLQISMDTELVRELEEDMEYLEQEVLGEPEPEEKPEKKKPQAETMKRGFGNVASKRKAVLESVKNGNHTREEISDAMRKEGFTMKTVQPNKIAMFIHHEMGDLLDIVKTKSKGGGARKNKYYLQGQAPPEKLKEPKDKPKINVVPCPCGCEETHSRVGEIYCHGHEVPTDIELRNGIYQYTAVSGTTKYKVSKEMVDQIWNIIEKTEGKIKTAKIVDTFTKKYPEINPFPGLPQCLVVLRIKKAIAIRGKAGETHYITTDRFNDYKAETKIKEKEEMRKKVREQIEKIQKITKSEKKSTLHTKAVETIKKHPQGITAKEIAREIGTSKQKVGVALSPSSLLPDGLEILGIKRTKEKNKVTYYPLDEKEVGERTPPEPTNTTPKEVKRYKWYMTLNSYKKKQVEKRAKEILRAGEEPIKTRDKLIEETNIRVDTKTIERWSNRVNQEEKKEEPQIKSGKKKQKDGLIDLGTNNNQSHEENIIAIMEKLQEIESANDFDIHKTDRILLRQMEKDGLVETTAPTKGTPYWRLTQHGELILEDKQ